MNLGSKPKQNLATESWELRAAMSKAGHFGFGCRQLSFGYSAFEQATKCIGASYGDVKYLLLRWRKGRRLEA
jgi:hypothetical protein